VFCGLDFLQAIHVFLQGFGNVDGAVGVLVVFDQGDEDARAGDDGVVEGVAEFYFAVIVAVAEQFTLTIGGVGGQFTAAGFYLDTVLLRTMEGNPADDSDPNHIQFNRAAVIVADITVKDPIAGETITLDGIFGMNFLTASVDLLQGDGFPEITDIGMGHFNWVTFDEPNGILGLDVATVPEPASAGVLALGVIAMLARRRR
jgi:hypothetical protein